LKKTFFKLGITGHTNVEKANGMIIEDNGTIYNDIAFKKVYKEINDMVKTLFYKSENLVFISGMARGVDEIFAIYAMNHNIPLIASIPYSLEWHKNRGLSRNVRAQAIYYDKIISYINNRIDNGCQFSKIVEVPKNYNDKEYKFANFARNQNIIDESEGVVSYYKYDSSGTKDAIKKAKKYKKYLGNVSSFSNLKNLTAPLKFRFDVDLFDFDTHVLIHGANCFNTMGKGIAKIIKEKYPEVYKADLETIKGDRNKLGTFSFSKTKDGFYIANAYTQYTYYDKSDMFYIDAFENSLNSIIEFFIKKRADKSKMIKFSFPAIGLGLANGDIKEIYSVLKNIEKKYLNDNIELNLCIKDKNLTKDFKSLLNSEEFEEKSKKRNKKLVIDF